ncbi:MULTISPECIES: Uma2 family endonuclease [Nostocales]|uniref:Uma2 family endonuclease n=1 Tax=Dolichospermum flos-aquae UHCC 0037 TaxID=2590026 RepID=A0ACC7S0M7_DOLFA|nr:MULTISPECIES: Uma2 family endonuclease [Nostocales]MBO1064164.1 Uma2 family endonuclease [Anabaena sp. 54]MTJ42023.1 Uma2 family endonuclease [Dolichospermum flos-aquae UHCC 0037]
MVIKKPDINNTQNLILPLESGDRLSRHEFERRYTESLHVKKAELIEGVVYVASPLRFQRHAEPHAKLVIWLGNYQIATPGVKLGIEPTIRLDQDNEPQPDGILFIDQSLGGKSRITADDYIEGSPELVAEIAASSAAYDLHDKKKAYRRNGIQEYIVWQSLEKKLNWFQLHESEYISLEPDANGVIKSQVMPGLWLAVPALLSGDMTQVLAVLQAGLNSPEHAEFLQNR